MRAATAADPDRGGGLGLEAALWRAVAVYRTAALGYAAVLIVKNSGGYAHPAGGWAVLAVMTGWTVAAWLLFRDPRRGGPALLAADMAVAAGCVIATAWVESVEGIVAGRPTLPVSWVAAPSWRGPWWAAAASASPPPGSSRWRTCWSTSSPGRPARSTAAPSTASCC
ncbi:DUF5931 domain-containing protein [Actinomadura sp. CNU-125]|uniref:DUF5931 domain-containing protein n=1 Tax=Actinomadura sp. CNU-125 TaxID=1904961 RepID=UPI0021CCDB77|nr:DUF5931 domain-containing protein [Actinomadura sp. CNU-125]